MVVILGDALGKGFVVRQDGWFSFAVFVGEDEDGDVLRLDIEAIER